MDQGEMIALIRGGVTAPGGVWADLGAGGGNFSWALAALLGADATVYAFDRDGGALAALRARLISEPPPATILPQQADIRALPPLPPLDGVLAANVLHFLPDHAALLPALAGLCRPGGTLLLVEYDEDAARGWLPHPLPAKRLLTLAAAAGLRAALVGRRVSPRSGQALYAATLHRRADARQAN